jgi:hypothetical protein
MFAHTCTSCHRRTLVFPGQVTSMTNTEHGIVVAFTCWCDAEQVLVTGKRAGARREAAAAHAA